MFEDRIGQRYVPRIVLHSIMPSTTIILVHVNMITHYMAYSSNEAVTVHGDKRSCTIASSLGSGVNLTRRARLHQRQQPDPRTQMDHRTIIVDSLQPDQWVING